MKRQAKVLAINCITLSLAAHSEQALAGGYGVRVGPPSIGVGHANPVVFTRITDYEFTYMNRGGFETSASIIGLLFGRRMAFSWGGTVSMGGGLVVDANGAGPGVYTAFGMDLVCLRVCVNIEYKQAMGFSKHILNPYAIRLGAIVWTD